MGLRACLVGTVADGEVRVLAPQVAIGSRECQNGKNPGSSEAAWE